MRLHIVLLALAVLCGGCSHALPTRLPEQRPADLDITESNGGGMVRAGDSTHISAKGCQFERWYGPNKVRAHFSLKPAELDKLYAVLRKNHFDRIQTRREEGVYDRGGVTVSVSWGKKSYSISNAGLDFVRKDWARQWKAVLRAIDETTDHALEPKKVSVKFVFDTSLAGRQVTLQVGSRAQVRRQLPAGGSGKDFEIPVRDLPGPYALHIEAGKAKAYDGTIELAAGRVFRFTVASGALALEGADGKPGAK